jgi:hypothetical protein
MSANLEATADEMCASCGKAEVNDIKLKKCACNVVKYCSVDCQKNHRPHHKKLCKERMAEIREDHLFSQPDESHLGECPLCCLPLPLDTRKSTLYDCCCKSVCNGCRHANELREMEQGLEERCPFCREPAPEAEEDNLNYMMERAKANDPVALSQMGLKRYNEGDYEGAFESYTKAAALGDMEAHNNIAGMYYEGHGVEKDPKKKIYHLEEAAIGGHPSARYNLGNHDGRNGRFDRAYKHHIIAAKLGFDPALEMVKKGFVSGIVSKEDYASALRGHQAAVDATKSQQRDEAEVFYAN